MTPEAVGYLSKARQCLGYARINFGVGLGNDAGRNAYLCAFHAAQAFIFERTGKVAKSHQGVHTEFNRLQKMNLESIWTSVVSYRKHILKAVADYEMGPDSEVPLVRAKAAIENAEEFIVCINNYWQPTASLNPIR